MHKRNLLHCLTIIFVVCHSYAGFSQQAWTIFNSTNSPLPENSVRCIAIAPDGKKWIGTDYGLASYDNVTWTVYYTNNSGLPDNSVRSVAVDSSGIVWIGTFSSGLSSFDGINWTNYNTFNSDIPDDFVRSLAIDTLGNKWVGTIGGLAYFDGVTWEIYNMSNTNILSNNMSSLFVDANDNSVAVGTINGGLALIDNNSWTFLNIWNTNLPDNSILGVLKDTSGTLWLATPAHGLSAYIGGFAFLTLSTVSSGIQSNSLTALSINRTNDDIWIASNDEGVIRKSGLNFVSFNTSNSPMPDNFIQVIKVAPDGIIWIGTQTGGLVRLDETLLSSNSQELYVADLKIFPVPANESLTLNFAGKVPVRLEVYDLNGKVCIIMELDKREQRAEIETSLLPAGTYLVKVNYSDGNFQNKKFIVEH